MPAPTTRKKITGGPLSSRLPHEFRAQAETNQNDIVNLIDQAEADEFLAQGNHHHRAKQGQDKPDEG